MNRWWRWLVDVLTGSDLFLGSRALWTPSRVREIILTKAQPDSIGLVENGPRVMELDPCLKAASRFGVFRMTFRHQ